MFRLAPSALILALTLGSWKTPPVNPAEIFTSDIDGRRFNLTGHDAKASVLFFVTVDCPITNNYAPEINRIVARYSAQHVAFYAVYTDPTVSVRAIQRHALEFGFKVPLILDTNHSLVHRVGATVTPEVAVLEPKGKLIYLGPIDDLYADFGKRRPAPTQTYLRQALDAILSGKPVAVPAVRPIGCFIVADP